MQIQTLELILTEIDGAGTPEEIHQMLDRIGHQLGFSGCSYISLQSLPLASERLPFFMTSVKPEFLQDYQSLELLGYDPVVVRAATSNVGFSWDTVSEFGSVHGRGGGRRGHRSRGHRVFELAHDHGYRHGFVLPLHAVDQYGAPSSSLVTLFWQDDVPALPKEATPLWLPLIAAAAHERIRVLRQCALQETDPPAAIPVLTDREREVLVWTCRGKTRSETADILHISDRTVQHHLRRVMSKLNVHNKFHAIAVAVSLRLISI
jgi:LuxR family transcriptional regulator, quorum-sensing system regulator BjaR1